MNVLAAYGLLAHGVIFGALVSHLPLGPLRPRMALLATAVALIGGIAPLMLGTFGAPSLTLLLLAIFQLAGRPPSPVNGQTALGLLFFALIFYPLALGWGNFDPYALGYQPWPLLGALLPLAGALYWRRQDLWLLILSGDLAAYAGGLFVNLWDALVDPLLVLLALAVVGRQCVRRINASRIR